MNATVARRVAPPALLLVAAAALSALSLQAPTRAANSAQATTGNVTPAVSVDVTRLPVVHYRTEKVGDLDVFYREAGPQDAPTVVLLHGFPTSSVMFRNLIPILATRYHVIAPDYPGYGRSSMPSRETFKYTFDNLANTIDTFLQQKGVTRFAIYVQDYGAPVGYRLFEKNPDRITALLVQNGNAYMEGLDNDFWKPLKAYWANPASKDLRDALRPFTKLDATNWQYAHGAPDTSLVSPDAAAIDQYYLDRPGNDEVQLDLFLDYGSNPAHYPAWQKLFREKQPPTLIVWGKNDKIFPPAGAEPYKRDLKTVEYHLLDNGHFLLEENPGQVGGLIVDFLDRNLKR